MPPRAWVGLLVLAFAGLVRLPHADISWFGNDQINFVAEGRRILAGDWNVVGPLAAGFNVIGPLYSFLLAGLLWMGKDAAFLAGFNAGCELAAAWLVYDTARRLSGQAAGVAAGVVYAAAPMLMISTRLIWNPSLLPAAVALGCWLVVRYCERPSTGRLVALALTCGLAMTLHATAVFPVTAWVLIVLLAKWPSPKQFAATVAVGLLPLAPLCLRLIAGSSQTTGALPIAANDVLATLAGIGKLMLSFPIGAYGEHWSARPAAAILHLDALLALAGLAIGLMRGGQYRAVWIGVAWALSAHLAGAVAYSGYLTWYYFTGAVPLVCLCLGQAVGAWPRLRVGAASLVVALAMVQVVFVQRFDDRAIEMGFIRFQTERLTLRLPPASTHGIILREVAAIGAALRDTYQDGVTAMRASHGARAELWRESDAEFMPRVAVPRDDWTSDFVLMGADATALRPGARLVGDRVCLFDRSGATWKVRPADAPAGWDAAGFVDDRWYPVDLPRRMTGPLSAGPSVSAMWRTPLQYLRGRLTVEQPGGQRLLVVSLHSNGNSQHWIARFALNGTEIAATKSRLMQSSVFRNEEWLFDLTGRLKPGENLLALAVDGQTPAFDLDVFELPCLDAEWYNLSR